MMGATGKRLGRRGGATRASAADLIDPDEETFDIKQMAEEFDVSYRALRLYEQKGILKPRRIGNRRLFTQKDWWRLAYLLRVKKMGFSIREARELIELHDGTIDSIPQLEAVVRMGEKNLERMLAQRDAIDSAYKQLSEYIQSARIVIRSRRIERSEESSA